MLIIHLKLFKFHNTLLMNSLILQGRVNMVLAHRKNLINGRVIIGNGFKFIYFFWGKVIMV